MRPLSPLLKWAGGKRWLLPRLQQLWAGHEHRRLVEPFAGALAVSLGLRPARALLNDINPHVINFHRQVRAGLELRRPMANESTAYYAARDQFNALIADGAEATPQAAELFFYLNRTGYNGLCRFNRRGQFNVPFGRYAAISYERDFAEHRAAFRDWEFTCGDFATVPLEPGDFVYADPPYDVPFTSYAREDFGWADQVRLAEWLARHPGPVVLSNQATEAILALYAALGFDLHLLDGPRMISASGDRTPAREVLATRNLLPAGHHRAPARRQLSHQEGAVAPAP